MVTATRFELADWQCIDLLEGETVGRACIIDDGFPLPFPVNYRLVRSGSAVQIVFRAAPSAALARYEGPASFEVDWIDATRSQAWSVIARGTVRRVTNGHELPDPRPLVDERTQWMRLDVSTISGRRFSSRPSHDSFSVAWQLAEPV
jgi:nitroimidazol reductase NimA-like FMN-containing flavoprotein (pyridoxamine 5'-phosphate oxidase superfamily)